MDWQPSSPELVDAAQKDGRPFIVRAAPASWRTNQETPLEIFIYPEGETWYEEENVAGHSAPAFVFDNWQDIKDPLLRWEFLWAYEMLTTRPCGDCDGVVYGLDYLCLRCRNV
jgi:hypothetical protein